MVRAVVGLFVLQASLALSTPSPAAAAPVEGRGTTVNSNVVEYSYSWRMSLAIEGTLAVAGETYGYFGTLEAFNYCCSYLGSSGSGYWYFNGYLLGASTWTGGVVSSSSPMTYTRTPIVDGAGSTLDMHMSGPARAYLPDGRAVDFNVVFDFTGVLSGGDPVTGLCGFYPGCRYDATYREQDSLSLIDVAPLGSASSTGVSVGWHDSSTSGGVACVSVTGSCSGGSLVNVCPNGHCSRETPIP